MTQKMSFSVENAEMISENPDSNFAVLSLDFFASGENLHDSYVSEETLMRTANTIKNCPIVWKYDELLDDVYTHDKDEVPCGFVPETFQIKNRKLPDGRTMLSVTAYVWKRYTGELLRIFKRDKGKKPVSVEMVVYKIGKMANGLTELLDFRYEGITVLGTYVTPAIPLASATVLSFAQMKDEYNDVYRKEFLFSGIDMTIPQEVKNNAKKGLELRKQFGKGGTSVSLSSAKYLINNINASPDKIKQIGKYFSRHEGDDLTVKDNPSNEYISSLLFGGVEGRKWTFSIIEQMEQREKERMNSLEETDKTEERETFNVDKSEKKEKSMEEKEKLINKEEEMASEEEVKEEEKMASEEEMALDKDKEEGKEEEMAKDEKEEDDKKEEVKEDDKEEDKEEDKPKKFEFPSNFDVNKTLELFGDDEDSQIKLGKEELSKSEDVDLSVLLSAMFAKMLKISEENSELREFKATSEGEQKKFEVEKTLKELSEKVVIPDEAKEEMKAEADKYDLANIETWKTYCKAKSFDFAVKKESESGEEFLSFGLPFTGKLSSNNDDLWAS